MSQAGDTPYWRAADEPEPLRDPEDPEPDAWAYDHGIVTQVALAYNDGPDPGDTRAFFKSPDDTSNWKGLHYAASNLWTAP
jgi:hypothetical protein